MLLLYLLVITYLLTITSQFHGAVGCIWSAVQVNRVVLVPLVCLDRRARKDNPD